MAADPLRCKHSLAEPVALAPTRRAGYTGVMAKSVWLTALTVLVLGCSRPAPPAHRQDARVPPKQAEPLVFGPAATPEEAIRQMWSARQAGDLDALLSTLAASERGRLGRLRAAVQALGGANVELEVLVSGRFGKTVVRRFMDFDFLLQSWNNPGLELEVTGTKALAGGEVEVTGRVHGDIGGVPFDSPEVYRARKEGAGWKVSQWDGPGEDGVQLFERRARATRQLVERMKAGKFASADAVVAAWEAVQGVKE